jgi:hypothetical protein
MVKKCITIEANLLKVRARYLKELGQAFCWLASGAGLLLATGCATPVNTEYKAGVNFSQYRTFALLPLPQQASASDPGAALRLAEPAREAVRSALEAKSLAEAPAGQADLAVNLRGQSLPRVEVKNYGYTYPAMTRYGYPVTVVQNPYTTVSTYDERTLIIELLDNRAKEVVWVGWMKKQSSGPVRAQDLQQAIREILAKYPPAESSKNKP